MGIGDWLRRGWDVSGEDVEMSSEIFASDGGRSRADNGEVDFHGRIEASEQCVCEPSNSAL